MNYISLAFSLFTSAVILGGGLLNTFEEKLPRFFSIAFRYGKFGLKEKSALHIEVPKSWFKHYYLVAIFIYSYIFYLVTSVYIFKNVPPNWFTDVLNVSCGQDRIASTSATKTYIALALLTLQVFRRFYDTQFISVYAKNGRMGLIHYFLGVFHYLGCILAILCEAPGFSNKSILPLSDAFNLSAISKLDIILIAVFLWAWWHQHVTTKILANLRKNEKGTVVTDSHKVPHGDWFYYLTAPHQTAEIVMYVILTLFLWRNFTWFFVFTWVLGNQVETILLTHWWYQEKFEDFPKNRKALIPFLY